MKIFRLTAVITSAFLISACGLIDESSLNDNSAKLPLFGQDLSFFSKYGINAILLGEGDSLIAVSPQLQGRVLTSTYGGAESPSLGWMNKRLITDTNADRQVSDLGGEDRLWLGPQGGDFSIFFPNGSIMNQENWRIPEAISSEPWTLVGRNKNQAKLEKVADIENITGTKFKVRLEREISVLTRQNVGEILGIEIPDSLEIVAFQSFNKITNLGSEKWNDKTGMLNLSVQSCFNANKTVRVFVPYRPGEPSKLGDIVRDNYFESLGTQTSGRLVIAPDYVQLKCDGQNRSGIGISPRRSEGIILSYDVANNLLTVVMYIKPSGLRGYLANSWRRNSEMFDGDAISLYNNGPLARTSMVAAPFYEISTSSPALELAAGKSQFHLQRTFHFHGSEYDLGLISYKLAGISITQLRGEAE